MFKLKPMGGYMKGEDTQTSSGSSTSTFDPAQSDFYDKLLGQAGSWLDQGGVNAGTDYSEQMGNILGQASGQYNDMINGGYDKEALNNAMDANAEAATRQFQQTVMPAIGTTSQLTGGGSGSRRGVAEGIAASNLNADITNRNQQMIWQAEQDAAARKQAGVQGQLGLLGQFANLSQYEQAQNNKWLESLGAYKDLISGDMGGTEEKEFESSGSAGGGVSWI